MISWCPRLPTQGPQETRSGVGGRRGSGRVRRRQTSGGRRRCEANCTWGPTRRKATHSGATGTHCRAALKVCSRPTCPITRSTCTGFQLIVRVDAPAIQLAAKGHCCFVPAREEREKRAFTRRVPHPAKRGHMASASICAANRVLRAGARVRTQARRALSTLTFAAPVFAEAVQPRPQTPSGPLQTCRTHDKERPSKRVET